jgi:hypothetical protein
LCTRSIHMRPVEGFYIDHDVTTLEELQGGVLVVGLHPVCICIKGLLTKVSSRRAQKSICQGRVLFIRVIVVLMPDRCCYRTLYQIEQPYLRSPSIPAISAQIVNSLLLNNATQPDLSSSSKRSSIDCRIIPSASSFRPMIWMDQQHTCQTAGKESSF